MTRTNLIARSLNDLGAAAWFGSALMGAVAVNRTSADAEDGTDRNAADTIWRRWWPVNAAAIGANLVGGALLTVGNRERVVAQRGVASLSMVKTAVTVTAVAAAACAGWLGKRAADGDDATAGDATTHDGAVSRHPAHEWQRILQWAVPTLTGLTIVLNAAQGEQQRPQHVLRGVLRRLDPAA